MTSIANYARQYHALGLSIIPILAGNSLTRSSDVSSLSIPTEVSVPKSIDEASSLLDDVGGLLSAGHWGTAAIVWAFTEPGTGGPRTVSKVIQLSLREFAELGIRGLSSINTVRKYRQAWEDAIQNGWAKRAVPGKKCTLPEQPFELPKIVHDKTVTPPKAVDYEI